MQLGRGEGCLRADVVGDQRHQLQGHRRRAQRVPSWRGKAGMQGGGVMGKGRAQRRARGWQLGSAWWCAAGSQRTQRAQQEQRRPGVGTGCGTLTAEQVSSEGMAVGVRSTSFQASALPRVMGCKGVAGFALRAGVVSACA